MEIKIITDSTSYIPQHLLDELDISVVPLSVIFDDETIKETSLSHHAFYEKLAHSKMIPTSSQPSVQEMMDAFEKQVLAGHAAVGIFISSDMSGTFSNAVLVRRMLLEKYPDAQIEIIDSRSNCMELGFAVLAAAKAAREGKNLAQVVAAASDVISKSRFLFVPATLEYLRKGGRIGGAAALFGSLLQIKPILTVVNGKTAVQNKVRTLEKAIQKVIQTCLDDIGKYGLGDILVHHIDDEPMGRKVAQALESALGVTVPVYSLGPVIGSHVGPGTTGIVYYTKTQHAE